MNPELMKLMSGNPGGSPSDASPPQGAPMSSPQPKAGQKQGAMVNVAIAMDLLEQALPGLSTESPEGQTVLAALKGLSQHFKHEREKGKELVPQEIMQMMQSLPETKGMMPGQGGMPGGGAKPPMPGGMPPPGGMPGQAPGGMPGMPPGGGIPH